MLLETFTYDLATRSWSVPALPNLDGVDTMVLAFGSPEMVAHPNVFQLLRDAYPRSSLIGCSSAGIIAGAEVRDRALSVVVAKLQRTRLRSAATLAREVDGSHAAGAALARKLEARGLRAVLVLAEGLRVDGEALVAGLRGVLGEEVVVAGGLAGDDLRFERTWVCSGNRLQSGLIAALGFYGADLVVGCGSESGWERFGPERTVTRADGATLHELDDLPAADVYRRYLGPRLSGLPAAGSLFPLAVWPPEQHDEVTIRPLLAAGDDGALLFAGGVPVGHRVQLMRTDADRLLRSATDAALTASRRAGVARTTGSVPGRTAGLLGIAVSAVGRRMALGERADEELKAVRRGLPPGVQTAGFYGYGEIAPGRNGRSALARQSMTMLLIGEMGTGGRVGAGLGGSDSEGSGPFSLGRVSAPAPAPPPPAFERPEMPTGDEPVDEPTATGADGVGDGDSGFAEVTAFSRDLDGGSWSVSPLPALDGPRTLVLVFASSEARAHPRAFADLRLAYPRSHIIGCSASGEILGLEGRERSMSVAVVRFAHTDLVSAQIALGQGRDGAAAGESLGRELARSDLRAVLVFSSAPAIRTGDLIRGLRDTLGDEIPIAGSLAAGGSRGEHAWVVARGAVARQSVAALGLYGDHVITGYGAQVGWDDMGPAREVRAQGGVLLKFDGQPALLCYQESLGANKDVPGPVPLVLASPDGARQWRPVVGTDDRQRSVTVTGAVAPDVRVQLVRSTAAQLIDSAHQAAQAASEMAGHTGPNALGLLLGNTVRRLALGAQAQAEIESVASAFGGIRLTGCFARGTIWSPRRRRPATGSDVTPEQDQPGPGDEGAIAVVVLGESPRPLPGALGVPLPVIEDEVSADWEEEAPTASSVLSPGRASALADPPPAPVRPPPPVPTAAAPAPPPSPPAGAIPDARPGAAGSAPVSVPPGPGERFAIETFYYDAKHQRWSVPSLPALDSPRTLVLAFGATELSGTPEVFAELRAAYPRAHILGCSTAGEIAGARVRDHSLSVAVVRFAHSRLSTASVVVGDAAGSFAAGQVLAHKLDEAGLRVILLLAEGLDISGSELLRGIKSVINEAVTVTGGLAGDGVRFERTWALHGDSVQPSLVTAVGLYGDHLSVGQGAEGGWRPLGPSARISKSSGHVLYQIDGLPALAWYRDRLGPRARELPASGLLYPLGLEVEGEAFLVRTVLAIDEKQQSMTFAGDVPVGSRVLLLGASSDALIAGAADAAEAALGDMDVAEGKALGLLVSEVGRRVVLGDRADDELAAAVEPLLPEVACVGFYGYGGFSGLRGRPTVLHNQTFLVTLISESETPLTQPTAAAVIGDPGLLPPPSPPRPEPRARSSAAVAPLPADATGPRERVFAGPESEVYRRDVNGIRVIELVGRLNESFDGQRVVSALWGTVVIEMDRIERVTSFGVREWMQMLERAKTQVDDIYLARCSEAFVNQLILIRALTAGAWVVSFAAPYLCRSCDHAFTHVFDCEHDAAAISAATPPELRCPSCGAAAHFDEDPAVYFSFVRPHLGRLVPAPVRLALAATAAPVDEGTGGFELVDKRVLGDRTQVRVRGRLDESVPWSRILEGVESHLELELGEIAEVTKAGLDRLDTALAALGDRDVWCEIERSPSRLTEHLAQLHPVGVRLRSAYVDARCPECQAARSALIEVDTHVALLSAGRFPKLLCKRCSSPLGFDGSRELLSYLAGSADADLEPARPRPRWAFGVASAVALVAAFGLGTWYFGVIREGDPDRAGVDAGAVVVTPAAVSDAGAAPMAVAGLPPAWVDRAFVVGDEEVLVVGKSGPQPGPAAAAEAAYRNAVRSLLIHMLPALEGAPAYGYARTHIDLDALSESGPELSAIVTRYETQVGAHAGLERMALVSFSGAAGSVAVAGQYRMPRAAYDQAVALYRSADRSLGMVVVPVFPLLTPALPGAAELLVVEVERRSPADRAGVEPGDLIVRVGGRYVSSLSEYGPIVNEAWDQTRRRRSLEIEVIAAGAHELRRLPKRR
ncbi:FIST N-terminal domain-containing protein [Haliangium sp.]|uniref:FIST N-terminal domain-containing protein n=1 Tax=Haliangium sp. TaxID=2663208 RepID=UPI003D135BBA